MALQRHHVPCRGACFKNAGACLQDAPVKPTSAACVIDADLASSWPSSLSKAARQGPGVIERRAKRLLATVTAPPPDSRHPCRGRAAARQPALDRAVVKSGLSGLCARAYGALTKKEVSLGRETDRRFAGDQS
jgi:hypothetical protein